MTPHRLLHQASLHRPGLHRPASMTTHSARRAAAQQLDAPQRRPHPGRPRRGSAPLRSAARRRGARQPRWRSASVPLRQRRSTRAVAPRPRRRAAAGGRRSPQCADLAEHGGERGAAQPLLHRPQHVLVAPAARQQQAPRLQAAGGKPGHGDRRREHHSTGAPVPWPAAPGCRRRRRRARRVLLVRPRSHHLVQRAEREPAAGQCRIERATPTAAQARRRRRSRGRGCAAAGRRDRVPGVFRPDVVFRSDSVCSLDMPTAHP